MNHRIIMIFAASLILFSGVSGKAKGDYAITTPAGLHYGDHFYITFVTKNTNIQATNSSISYYNNLVNTDAQSQAGGAVTYLGQAVTFKAIASTDGMNARNNTGIALGATVPIYMADGTLVSSGNLWSGTLLHAIDEHLTTSTSHPNYHVFTGTTSAGLKANNATLGNISGNSKEGLTNTTTNNWVANSNRSQTSLLHLYGISQELTVTPEPTSMALLAAGAPCILALRRFRRKSASA